MKKVTLIAAGLLLAGISVIYSCKKDSTTTTTPTPVADDTQQQAATASDQNQVDNGTNKALDDANTAVMASPSINGRIIPGICGGSVTVNDSSSTNKQITITYDGTSVCDGFIRSGSIIISLNEKWKMQNAVMTITFNNYTLTNALVKTKSIVINGHKNVTNVSGGRLDTLKTVPTAQIVYDVHGTLTLNIKDSTATATATWGIARKHTYTGYGTDGRQQTISGDSTVNGTANVPMAGTNRYGVNFYVTLSTPVVSNNVCGWNAPTAGVRVINGIAHPLTLTLGLDATGKAVTSGCATDYEVSWTNAAGVAKTKLIAY